MRRVVSVVTVVSAMLFVHGCSPHGFENSELCTAQLSRHLQTDDGRPAYIEAPTAVGTPGGFTLLGTPAFLWSSSTEFDGSPGITARDTAAYIEKLKSNHGFIGFAVVPAKQLVPLRSSVTRPLRRSVVVRSVHSTFVVWLSPADTSSDSPDSEVWVAELRENSLTNPTRVFSADKLEWSGARPSVLISGDSMIHIVLGFQMGPFAGIARISGRGLAWKQMLVARSGLPSQVTAELLSGDSIAIAYAGIGAPGLRTRNGQHVFLIRAALNDTIWPEPQLVHFSGTGSVADLTLHSAGNGNPGILVWRAMAQQSGGSAETDSLYAWPLQRLQLPELKPFVKAIPFRISSIAQVTDARGMAHLAITRAGPLPPSANRIQHVSVSGSEWSPLRSLYADSVSTPPVLLSLGGDSLILLWGTARPAGINSPRVAPTTRYTVFRPRCLGMQ